MNQAQNWNQNLRTIEGMDIFEVLDISASSLQREQFLAQLGDAIWSDVVQSKLEDLSEDQLQRIDMVMTDQQATDNQKYERLFTLFQEAVPNAQELMTAAAKRVKIEFLRARIEGLQTFYAQKPEALAIVNDAMKQFEQAQYHTAVNLLKTLPQ